MTQYMDRVNAGVCVTCQTPHVTHGRRCETCRDYFNKYARERTAETMAVGCCVGCGKAALPGFSRCEICRNRNMRRAKGFRMARNGGLR